MFFKGGGHGLFPDIISINTVLRKSTETSVRINIGLLRIKLGVSEFKLESNRFTGLLGEAVGIQQKLSRSFSQSIVIRETQVVDRVKLCARQGDIPSLKGWTGH
jgi:hypothetical protein